MVEVKLPIAYHKVSVEFVSLVLEIGIDTPHTEARVVVNGKTDTIVVTGEADISPVIISHKNLTVEVGAGNTGPSPGGAGRFVGLFDWQNAQTLQQLQSLLEILNELRVPTEDVISIVRELHRTGKLHALYEEY